MNEITMTRVLPPKGATNVCYGSTKVGPEGIDVTDAEVEQLTRAGWTIGKSTTPKPKLASEPKATKGKG